MPSETELLPIREVTRLTGVNPVTLRAWERRYGLIVPQRTSKGHRLYSPEHVLRIRQILHWLDRGVAVGQVKPLLDSAAARDTPADDEWQTLRARLVDCVEQLAERRLDQQFNQAMALYPATTLCEHLMLPLLAELEIRWQRHPTAQMEQVFFHSWLRSKLGSRIYHNNRQLPEPPILLINGSNLLFDAQLWLCAWLISDSGAGVEVFDWPLPPRQLASAIERLGARALLISLNAAVDIGELQRGLTSVKVPKLLFGSVVSLYRQALEAAPNPLHLLDTPLSASRHVLTRSTL